jgi:hypothetical protein
MSGFLGAMGDRIEVAIARIGGPEMPAPIERRPLDDGTRKLQLAVLVGASHDYRDPQLRAEVLEWIASTEESSPFDFASISRSFGYSADWMRRRTLRLLAELDNGTARQLKRSPAGSVRIRHPKPPREHRRV